MKVEEISNKVQVISADAKLSEAAKMMADEGLGCLVVMDNDSVEGIITERDILKQVSKDVSCMGLPVRDFMSPKLVTIDYEAELDEAAAVMRKHKIKKLPVMKKGKICGIITSTDLVANAEGMNELSFF
ncbi:CBS domain-containing protein [Candidatus Woesearchaeota archaeon]|nr:CBS domain-containing protein [Candidatus Woesearchaeota archaeon]